MSLHEFVHLGDLHLRGDRRNLQRLAALDQAIAVGMAMAHLEAWLWPGDLNDRRMTIDDRNALAERLRTMADFAPVVICCGNHDLPGDLDVFARLRTRYPGPRHRDAADAAPRDAVGRDGGYLRPPVPDQGRAGRLRDSRGTRSSRRAATRSTPSSPPPARSSLSTEPRDG